MAGSLLELLYSVLEVLVVESKVLAVDPSLDVEVSLEVGSIVLEVSAVLVCGLLENPSPKFGKQQKFEEKRKKFGEKR